MARIVRFAGYGGPEVLEIHDEPLQETGEGELRLKVEAIGLNRAEIMFRTGHYVANAAFPSRIGIEASGTIDALGPGVSGFSIGERAAAVPFISWDEWGNWTPESVIRYGVYGESAVVPAFCVARTPDGIPAVEAGAIWCQYATAWGGLVDHAGVSSDDIVLVTAASSSAGLGGLQIAKNAGATVIAATRKAEKADFLYGAGADHVVATEEEDLETRVKAITGGQGFTIAYDPVGGAFIGDLVAAAQPCGLIERSTFPAVEFTASANQVDLLADLLRKCDRRIDRRPDALGRRQRSPEHGDLDRLTTFDKRVGKLRRPDHHICSSSRFLDGRQYPPTVHDHGIRIRSADINADQPCAISCRKPDTRI